MTPRLKISYIVHNWINRLVEMKIFDTKTSTATSKYLLKSLTKIGNHSLAKRKKFPSNKEKQTP